MASSFKDIVRLVLELKKLGTSDSDIEAVVLSQQTFDSAHIQRIATLKREVNELKTSEDAKNSTINRLQRTVEAKDKAIKELQDKNNDLWAQIHAHPSQKPMIDVTRKPKPSMQEMMRAKEMRQQMAFIISEAMSIDHHLSQETIERMVGTAKRIVDEIHTRIPS